MGKFGSSGELPPTKYASIVDGLKTIYRKKIRPVEMQYNYEQFTASSPLTDADIEAKPMILLLGQYSTGKTTFIRHLVEKDYPGCHIGPEPTTDRFVAVMGCTSDAAKVIPGNAACVAQDQPFTALQRFGTSFLSKFQISQTDSSLLDSITLVDTPGVLSGEKQRIGRSYDFIAVCKWFAERADMILLLFDAHKLDISDEFKSVITVLKGHDEKIRVVLNKADRISNQQLMRCYGALMWSLGKVIASPEVCRVYIGSFWDQVDKQSENYALIEAEQKDLINDLMDLPRNAAIRKINEFVKRARLAKVHAHIIGHLRSEMPAMFGKSAKQAALLDNLAAEFTKIQRNHNLPAGDFPDVAQFRAKLEDFNMKDLNKLDKKLINNMDEVLAVDLPRLMEQFPMAQKVIDEGKRNPFADPGGRGPLPAVPADLLDPWEWSSVDRPRYAARFSSLGPIDGKVSGAAAKTVLVEAARGAPLAELGKIWGLADLDGDGYLTSDEFCLALHLCAVCANGTPIPDMLPRSLIPPGKVKRFSV